MSIRPVDNAQLAELRDLHRQMTDIDKAIANVDGLDENAKARELALRERLARLDAGEAPVLRHDNRLIAAMVADPTHSPDTDAIAAAIQRQRSAREAADLRSAEASMVQGAIAGVEGERGRLAANRKQYAKRRHALWRNIVKLGHTYLVDAFEEAFAELVTTYLAPLHALTELRDPETGDDVLRNPSPSLCNDSLISVKRRVEVERLIGGGKYADMSRTVHFPFNGPIRGKLPEGSVERFFAMLAADAEEKA